jgi:hypothetical protein
MPGGAPDLAGPQGEEAVPGRLLASARNGENFMLVVHGGPGASETMLGQRLPEAHNEVTDRGFTQADLKCRRPPSE